MATIFDKILDGEIPNYTVYENEHALAFLDINPAAKAHTLVIPKQRVSSIDQLRPEVASGFIHAIQQVNSLLKEKLGCDGINHLIADGSVAGQEVMHLHMHLVPRFKGDGLRMHPVGKNIDMSADEFKQLQKQLQD